MKLHQRKNQSQPSKQALKWVLLGVLGACIWASTLTVWGKDKIKIEELIARHLESIGTAEARAGIESIVATGEASAIPRVGGSGKNDGDLRMISTSGKSLIYMKFYSPDYAEEALLFDGKKVDVGQMRPGTRSPLGQLLYTQDLPLKEGLWGGTLSRDWPLLSMEAKQPRLKYRGLRKVDKEKYHEVEYRARKGGTDFKIRLYFDQEHFRHVRTTYQMSIAAPMGSRPGLSSQQSETRIGLIEKFSDFRQENGLTLPRHYVIRYSNVGSKTLRIDWEMKVNDIQFNQPLEGAFVIHR